jgi:hypothetical protein
MIKVQSNGKQIVLSMVEGKVYAIDNVCTHRQGQLNEGEWVTNLNSYPVKVNETNGDILVNPNGGTKV